MKGRRNYLLISTLLFLILLTGALTPSLAATLPFASGVDSRLRYTHYHPDQVYILRAAIGRALFIEFERGEEMESFYTGDSEAWEVGKHGNLVALKPTAELPNTNLIISTTAGRVYTFDLVLNEKTPMYGIRFSYPEKERLKVKEAGAKHTLAASLNPETQALKNHSYSGRGSFSIQPAEIFDNGTHTFLYFPENMSFPAVFEVSASGAETLVNKTVSGNWLILPRVGKMWRLRYGDEVLCIRNDAFFPNVVENRAETTAIRVWRSNR